MDLFDAAAEGNLERIRAAVEQDADVVHHRDEDGWTLFMLAARLGHIELGRYLLDHGADPHVEDDDRCTALHHAVTGPTDIPGMVSLLLAAGASVTHIAAMTDTYFGPPPRLLFTPSTPLMAAAHCGHEASVRVLLEHGGSDLNHAELTYERTSCHMAASEGHAGVLRQLLEAGADPTLRDGFGRTAMDYAAVYRRRHCITILQEWERAYKLCRVRQVRDAAPAPPPAAPRPVVSHPQAARTVADAQQGGEVRRNGSNGFFTHGPCAVS